MEVIRVRAILQNMNLQGDLFVAYLVNCDIINITFPCSLANFRFTDGGNKTWKKHFFDEIEAFGELEYVLKTFALDGNTHSDCCDDLEDSINFTRSRLYQKSGPQRSLN
jgi:hypothetical protein